MQVSGGGIGHTVASVYSEGITAFWKGLVFAYGRELSYTSIKLGAYAPVRDFLGAGGDAPFYLKFVAGAITGGVGSVIGNPFDVMKTLAQTNKEKSVPLMTLVGKMYHDQGMSGFYRGVEVNVMRACVLNATKMGVYDVTKGFVVEKTGWQRKDLKTSFSAAAVAGFFMTCTVAPWDMLRTKLMNQPTDQKIYSGFTDCLVKTVKNDGVLSLWRGFIPIWARFAPQATLQLLTIDFLYTLCGFKSI
jgi:Mitochondrial carrier protein